MLEKAIKDASLKYMQFQSGIIAEVSIYGIFEERKYNWVMRLHKIIYESLLKAAWKWFYTGME